MIPKKLLYVPRDCEGALQNAIRVRIIYLQAWRLQTESLARQTKNKTLQASYKATAQSMMQDIANLTMLGDNLAEAELA